jgi:hypothetical protein
MARRPRPGPFVHIDSGPQVLHVRLDEVGQTPSRASTRAGLDWAAYAVSGVVPLGLPIGALNVGRLAHRILRFEGRTQGTPDHRQRASQPG